MGENLRPVVARRMALASYVHDEELADLVVDLCELLVELAALLFGELEGLCGDLVGLDYLVALLALVVICLPANEVDDAAEVVLDADGHLDCCCGDLELLPDLVDDAPGVCTGTAGDGDLSVVRLRCPRIRHVPIHLVDEGDPGDVVPTHLPVYRCRLALHACHGTEHENSSVKNAQCAFYLYREVDVTWKCSVSGRIVAARSAGGMRTGCIDDVDGVFLLLSGGRHGRFPVAERRSALDGDALLAFKFHTVHLRAHVVTPADLHECK